MTADYTPKDLSRFWNKIDRSDNPDACWNWTAGTVEGYGQVWWNGRMRKAHRVSYELTYGSCPDDLCVLHKCDNRLCCNPKHFFLGTRLDNNRDRVQKGRNGIQRGELNGNCRLSDAQIAEIRRLYDEGHVTQKELGTLFGVGQPYISAIVLLKFRK